MAKAGTIALLVAGLAAGTAFAARGTGKVNTSSTMSLSILDGSDTVANRGERVGFNVSTSATDRPFVGVRCYQGLDFVLDAYTGYFPTYMYEPWVTLGSPYWHADQSADCTARLFYYDKRGNQKVLTTLTFVVRP